MAWSAWSLVPDGDAWTMCGMSIAVRARVLKIFLLPDRWRMFFLLFLLLS
jgi:hypothetical protein